MTRNRASLLLQTTLWTPGGPGPTSPDRKQRARSSELLSFQVHTSMSRAAAHPPLVGSEVGGGDLPRKATFTALGLGGHKMDTAVMTPSVPSDPMNSCFRS